MQQSHIETLPFPEHLAHLTSHRAIEAAQADNHMTVTATKVPKVGDDVLYVLHDGRSAGLARPAKVVNIWENILVNLQVFTDGTNDYRTGTAGSDGTLWRTSVHHASPALRELGTWHWPEEV